MKFTEKSDDAWDRLHHIIDGSAKDKKLDKKRGLKDD